MQEAYEKIAACIIVTSILINGGNWFCLLVAPDCEKSKLGRNISRNIQKENGPAIGMKKLENFLKSR